MDFPDQWRVRVKDSEGARHNILVFGKTEREATRAGMKQAKKLLEDPGVELVWCRPA